MSFASIRRSAIIAALVAAMVGLFGAAGVATAAPAPAAAQSAVTPLTGTFTDAVGGIGPVTGTFTPTQFVSQGNQVLAEGVANLTMIDSTGQAIGNPSPTLRLPVGPQQAGCQILDLVPATCWATCCAPSRTCSTARRPASGRWPTC